MTESPASQLGWTEAIVLEIYTNTYQVWTHAHVKVEIAVRK